MKKKVLRWDDFKDLVEYRKLLESDPCRGCLEFVDGECDNCPRRNEALEHIDKRYNHKNRRLEYMYASDIDVKNLIDAMYEYTVARDAAKQAYDTFTECRSKVLIDLTCGVDEIFKSCIDYVGDDYKEEESK